MEWKNLPDTSTPFSADNLNSTNKYVGYVLLDDVTLSTTSDETLVGRFIVPEDGFYMITASVNPNYYGESGREMISRIRVNNNNIIANCIGIINAYAFTLTQNLIAMEYLHEGDVITCTIQNSVEGKNWAFAGGNMRFLKLK